jgi:hypothetical protein
MLRDGKPEGFFCLDHRTADSRSGIIADTHRVPANAMTMRCISRVPTGREHASISMPALRARMRAMPRTVSPKGLKIAAFRA